MNHEPLIYERTFDAPVAKVWNAITDKDAMKEWYFDIAEFRAEVGFDFSFWAGDPDDKLYLHVCKVTEVIPNKKLSYTWRFEGHVGESLLTFELFPEGEKTKLKLTHAGVETFAPIGKGFAKENFVTGWNHLVNVSLLKFLEK